VPALGDAILEKRPGFALWMANHQITTMPDPKDPPTRRSARMSSRERPGRLIATTPKTSRQFRDEGAVRLQLRLQTDYGPI
jgi:hypothetical protein